MKAEWLLYGVLPGERLETLLIVRDREEDLAPYVERAKAMGMTGIRIHKCELGDAPDFANTLNV